jgi:hypothetical protein
VKRVPGESTRRECPERAPGENARREYPETMPAENTGREYLQRVSRESWERVPGKGVRKGLQKRTSEKRFQIRV